MIAQTGPTLGQPERTKRQERAERILDAATELLLRHGYNRITMDDIAKRSAIGKGTIYLHWKTKEALFGTLLMREAVSLWKELLQKLHGDPAEVFFSRVMRSMMLVGMQRPLARALFIEDRELLGRLVESGMGVRSQTQRVIVQSDFLCLLREYGLIRQDMKLAEQSYAIRATVTGFLAVESSFNNGEVPISLEQRANALGDTIHAAFEPSVQLPSETLTEIIPRLVGWLDQLISAFETQIQAQLE